MFAPTHRISIEHRAETGDTVDDGMGGEEAVTEWEAVISSIPGRYSEGDSEIEGRTQDVEGETQLDTPRVSVRPRDVGEMTWESVETGMQPEYDREVHSGSDWRVVIHGMGGGDERRVIDTVREQYGMGPAPTAVVLELERQASD